MDAKDILDKKLPTTEEEMAAMIEGYRNKMDLLISRLAFWQGEYMARASQYAIDLEARIYAKRQKDLELPYNRAELDAKHELADQKVLLDKCQRVAKTYQRIYKKWRRQEWTRT